MKYSKFKGTLYIPKGQTTDKTSFLTIEADGKTIYTSPEMTKTSRPVNIDVNISGYNDIKIIFHGYYENSSWFTAVKTCLGDAGFYQ